MRPAARAYRSALARGAPTEERAHYYSACPQLLTPSRGTGGALELSQPDSAAGLGRRLGLPRQRLNYHLRQLEDEGLVEVVGERKRRNCTERLMRAAAKSYLIGPGTLGELAADPARIRDRASSAYLVAVAARIIREVGRLRNRADRVRKRLPTLTLETEVRFSSPTRQHEFARELSQEIARLVAKYHDDDAAGGRTFRVLSGVHPVPGAGDGAGDLEGGRP